MKTAQELRELLASANADNYTAVIGALVEELTEDLIARRVAELNPRYSTHRYLSGEWVAITPSGIAGEGATEHEAVKALMTRIARTEPVGRPIDTSGMTGDGGKVSWPTS